ncbi:MAG TPA: hypothetical protein PK198_09940, partial [Saprospiraceae bacterium]|nr:hypothetical protein [Saprospiraceae bacterium]
MRKPFISMSVLLLSLAVFAVISSTVSCTKKPDNISRVIPESIGAYVYAFTSGMISKASHIKVQFATAAVEAASVGKEAAAGLISFSPGIKGKAVWEDERTLVFQP